MDPNRNLGLSALKFEPDHIFRFEMKTVRHRRANKNGVVPGHLGERLRKFLQPAVVGESPVVNGRIAPEINFDAVIGLVRGRKVSGLWCDLLRRVRCTRDPAIMKRLPPEKIEVSARLLLLPISLNQIMPSDFGLSGQERNHLASALPAVEWLDERLDNTDGAVVSARVTPGFEIMRLVDVPMAEFCGLVLVHTEMNTKRDVAAFQGVGKAKINGRIVSRVATQNYQHVHLARLHVLC